MTSKRTKAKRRRIPTFTIAELEDAGRLPPYSYLMDALDKRADQNRTVASTVDRQAIDMQTSIDLLVEQLPDEAKWWVKHLGHTARIEIDRLLKGTGVENFAKNWREHKADLEDIERNFDTKL